MNAQAESVVLLGILEKQLRLFRELSADLVASRTAYVAMNLDRMYEHIAAQAAICDRLRQIEHERKFAWSAASAALGLNPDAGSLSGLLARIDAKTAESMREVVTKLALAEGELRNLNRAHTVLIEGSRRTLAILGNVLASFAPTYSRPANAPDSGTAIGKRAAQ
jgi:FlgN protein